MTTEAERAELIAKWQVFVDNEDTFVPTTAEEIVDALILADLPDDARFHFEWRWTPQPPDTAPEDKVPFATLPKWIVVVHDPEDSDD